MIGTHYAAARDDAQAATRALGDAVLRADFAASAAGSAARHAADRGDAALQEITAEASNEASTAWRAVEKAFEVTGQGFATYLDVAHALDLARDPDA